ncbi:MAG: type II toxin-antitoxin system VapC family toxin [Candidatus Methanoperedens sp.]|nr:type II toxin-antitoxin system VapC family toxin [Candidatus Methanoperedens sp.]MCZ7369144.1 type II toxin-antitoxin system VapC family toxin [Candidatus Methanoperedens sp.]
MNYFDSNLIIYAMLDETEIGEWARGLLERMQNEEMPACTSFLTFDEVFYKVNKVKGSGVAIKNLEAFLTMPNMRFIDVNDGVIWKSLELIREYQLLPRDSIHAATAFIAGAETIFSEDTDFDNIPGLKRTWMF